MDTNVKGTFLSCQAAISYLKQSCGCIVTIASDVAEKGSGTIPLYSISKSAVLMMTKLLAGELAVDGVRVNTVLPANIVPGMRSTLVEEVTGGGSAGTKGGSKRKWVAEDPEGPDWVVPPIGRFGEVKEVADVVLFFASEEASYCSGTSVLIDGALNAVQE